MREKIVGIMGMILGLAVSSQAFLISNGDFETGDLTGWTAPVGVATNNNTTPLLGSHSASIIAGFNNTLGMYQDGFNFSDTATLSLAFRMDDPGESGDRGLHMTIAPSAGGNGVNLRVNGDGDVQLYSTAWNTVLPGAVTFGTATNTISIEFNDYGANLDYEVTVNGSTAAGLSYSQANAVVDAIEAVAFLGKYSQGDYTVDNVTLEGDPALGTPPTADNISTNVIEDGSVDITLSGTDPEGGALTYNVASMPANGTLTTNGALPDVTYTPDANFSGSDSFTYTVNDGVYDSAPATVSITVESVDDDAPEADDLEVAVFVNNSVEITLSGYDPEGSNLTYSVASGPSHGDLNATTGQVLVYTPDKGYVGSDSFTYTVNDGAQDSDPATVSITVKEDIVGELIVNGDFETNGGATGGGTTTTFTNWFAGSGSALIRNDIATDGGKVPGATGSVVIRLAKNSSFYQSFSTAWDSNSTFNVTLNACEVSWKANPTTQLGNGVWVSLQSATGTKYLEQLIDLDGTHDGTSRYESWETNQTFSLEFACSNLVTAGATANDELRLHFYSKNNDQSVNWIDNVSLLKDGGVIPSPTEVGDISIEVVSGGTEVVLSWGTEYGWDYGVKMRSSLPIGDWDTILTNGVPGTGGEVSITNPVSASPEFYRAYLDN